MDTGLRNLLQLTHDVEKIPDVIVKVYKAGICLWKSRVQKAERLM